MLTTSTIPSAFLDNSSLHTTIQHKNVILKGLWDFINHAYLKLL